MFGKKATCRNILVHITVDIFFKKVEVVRLVCNLGGYCPTLYNKTYNVCLKEKHESNIGKVFS